jgi:hypothetical protein
LLRGTHAKQVSFRPVLARELDVARVLLRVVPAHVLQKGLVKVERAGKVAVHFGAHLKREQEHNQNANHQTNQIVKCSSNNSEIS